MTSALIKLLSLALFACLMASVVSAGSIAPCPTAPLSVYVAATAPCRIGALEFGDFTYTNSYFPALLGPPASAILVTPSNNPADPGLELSSPWTVAGAGKGMDSALTYLVMTISGAPTIDEAVFGITDTIISQPVSIQFSEALCLGVALGPGKCPSADKIDLVVANQQTFAAFAPVSVMTISNDIFIKSNGESGNGTISSVTNNLPTPEPGIPTPEPGIPLLSLSGLLAWWLKSRVGARRLR